MPIKNNNRHRLQLDRWLQEWKIDQILSASVSEEPASNQQSSIMPESTATPLVGEIRLFFPVNTGESSERPLYVAVLHTRPDSRFLIAPFGRFAEPASPGELRTGLKQLPLRVLCLWNSHVVDESVLQRSWHAGQITAPLVVQAMDVYRHNKNGPPLEYVNLNQIGPPILHPLDPRLKYQAEEAELMYAHIQLPDAKTISYEIPQSTLLKAAEPRTTYGKEKRKGKKEQPCRGVACRRPQVDR